MTALMNIPATVVNFLQVLGAVFTLALLTVFIAESVRDQISPGKIYPVLLIIDVIILIAFGILGPFPPLISTALKWQGVFAPLLTFAFLTSTYLRHRKQFPTKKQKASRFRPVVVTSIVLCLLFFVVGIIGVWVGWLTSAQYALVTGVAGSVASVIGLWTFANSSDQQGDLAALEPEYLRRIAATSEEIKRLDLAKAAAEQQIGSLEAQKRQMEFLVQKAGLSLFLQEQRRLYEKRVKDEISSNKVLLSNLDELTSIEQKLKTLEEEISKDPNVDLLQRIIKAARRDTEETDFSEFPPLARSFVFFVRDSVKAMVRVLAKFE